MTFKAYSKVEWSKLGDFSKLTLSKEGESRGLDLGVVGETGNFAVSFEGVLHIEKEGGYRFRIGSDDGSAIYIDGQKVADADGIHPHQYGEGRRALTAVLIRSGSSISRAVVNGRSTARSKARPAASEH